jgi:hypothetical protein
MHARAQFRAWFLQLRTVRQRASSASSCRLLDAAAHAVFFAIYAEQWDCARTEPKFGNVQGLIHFFASSASFLCFVCLPTYLMSCLVRLLFDARFLMTVLISGVLRLAQLTLRLLAVTWALISMRVTMCAADARTRCCSTTPLSTPQKTCYQSQTQWIAS